MMFRIFRNKSKLRCDGVYFFSTTSYTKTDEAKEATWLLKFEKDPESEELYEVYVLMLDFLAEPSNELLKLFYEDARYDKNKGYPDEPIMHSVVEITNQDLSFDFLAGYAGIFSFYGRINTNSISFSVKAKSFLSHIIHEVYQDVIFKFYMVQNA